MPLSSPPRHDQRRPRVALYGHDTCGLGHLRRNLALAAALRSAPSRPDVLVVTGSPAAQRFPRPDGVEILVLPTIAKTFSGEYEAGALDVPLDVVVDLRSATAAAALQVWNPDLFIVDKVPGGFHGELAAALDILRANGTRIVLGLRDVLDESSVARAEWRRDAAGEAVDRWYDELWVYGDADVHDLRDELRLSPTQARRTRFLGYLADGRRTGSTRPLPGRRGTCTVLAGVGGGVDGAELTRTLLTTPLPAWTDLVLLPGPFADPELRAELEHADRTRPELHVVDFTDCFPDWAAAADAVVCMGGYNTVAEVLATPTPALVVPRTTPRQEQLVRARAMSARGLLDVAEDPTEATLSNWIRRATSGELDHAGARRHYDLDGLAAVRRRGNELIELDATGMENRCAS